MDKLNFNSKMHTSDFSLYNESTIRDNLSTERIGCNICFYNSIDSTNNEAKRLSHMPDGTLFVAETQTDGRGRKGNNWISHKDGIWFSILLKPDISPNEVYALTLVTGIAISRVINSASIKWPNDIVLNAKKIGGILTEMSSENGKLKYIVIGVGLNLNNSAVPKNLEGIATSVFIEKGTVLDKNTILADICKEMEVCYQLFLTDGFKAFKDKYIQNCVTLNRQVIIKTLEGSYEAKAVGISDHGQLLIERDGNITEVLSGEVSVRGLFGYI